MSMMLEATITAPSVNIRALMTATIYGHQWVEKLRTSSATSQGPIIRE
jgi:hypothetical protein